MSEISREVLEARWDAALIAPWKPGSVTKLWSRVESVVTEEPIQRVAMVDEETSGDQQYGLITEELFAAIHDRLIDELSARAMARTGYETIGAHRYGESPARD